MEHSINTETMSMGLGRRVAGRMPLQADLEAGLLPPSVPLLDADILDDDYEPDGVNDFMRGLAQDDYFDEF